MFFYKVEFTKKSDRIDSDIVREHLQRLEAEKDAGTVVFGGAFTDGTGGMTIFCAEDLAAAEAWVKQDAFAQHDTHSWTLRELKRNF